MSVFADGSGVNMNMRRVAICTFDMDDNMVGRIYLKSSYHKDLETEIESMFAIDVEDEMAKILLEEIKDNISTEDIKKLIRNTMESKKGYGI